MVISFSSSPIPTLLTYFCHTSVNQLTYASSISSLDWRGSMKAYFWITVGSALGGMARYWCSGVVVNLVGGTFPWGTLVVNVVGSFIIGFFGTLTGPNGRLFVPSEYRLFVMVGFCGGYTTFSSFSLQTLTLVQDGDWLRAGGNVAISVALCLAAVWLGHIAAASLNQ